MRLLWVHELTRETHISDFPANCQLRVDDVRKGNYRRDDYDYDKVPLFTESGIPEGLAEKHIPAKNIDTYIYLHSIHVKLRRVHAKKNILIFFA